MNAINKILKKRRTPQPRDTSMDWLSKIKEGKYKKDFWERDKKYVRESNFKKAQIALKDYRAKREQEKKRQADIAEQRLANLAKARAKKRRIK